jgi:pyridoxal phosphate enzyme (YggS family)
MISENVKSLLQELPAGVELEAAVKTRTPAEIMEAIKSGIKIIGHNYLQEAEASYPLIGNCVRWHFIGTLQKNKVKTAVKLFDMLETLDSLELAQAIDHQCAMANKTMPVLLEVNSGREPQKSGIMPEYVTELIGELVKLKNIRVMGLMTMGPLAGDPQDARPYFATTRHLFDELKSIHGIEMKYLSMGMTSSYKIALEEGANIIRIGNKIFGPR